jgi:hypothetical protein
MFDPSFPAAAECRAFVDELDYRQAELRLVTIIALQRRERDA